ncbi:glycosyltransferase family 39 protein [Suhomyces tanzawaensis NRRL Y-17324]|uniref:Dolichyl-phosphate-mannose--protein mannosyltransferase n=1 Tax=Suhomyces tanzawaensis NRRL Y-17324 TaxID=984487 RepID=A0A1E4SE85_9ASCO|nr:glycosyltransferase family 39 protein [Suhomyces tanzawaensis NRRL Y-17324]ODV77798.1 glycosyltransferase family 39 protein [Suhomyces tanzawaensis NRRL Y-17324]
MSDSQFSSGLERIDGDLRNRNHINSLRTSKTINHEQVDELDEIITKTNSLRIRDQPHISLWWKRNSSWVIKYAFPILLTSLSAFVRLYRIHTSNKVVWDEAHFGKFGSYYLKNEFYFDVHPPLGKLLVGLSGYLANYDGNFSFESGETFPENCNYVLMRCFNCIFGILCTPLAYKTSLLLGFSQPTTWFICLLVIFEMISLTLSKFILLDSMLLFFTVLSYYCLINIHVLRNSNLLLSYHGIKWSLLTGISIGCVCSVKWVGLFVTALVGLYTIYDLSIKSYQVVSTKTLSAGKYLAHWAVRIITLILVPFMIYSICFKIHFTILSRSGPGDGSISTLLQATLDGNTLKNGPRSVAYGSLITMRSQGLSPNLIHSHPHTYPEGSQQQQVTTYGFKDENNEFLVEFNIEESLNGNFATLEPLENDNITKTYQRVINDQDTIRLVHKSSGCLLHSHPILAAILKSHYEVSCYADLEGSDIKDEWIIEVQTQEVSPSNDFDDEDPTHIHPISTNFRLRHKVLGCYLATTGASYPAWGFQQGEVVCKQSFLLKDKSTWWNIEDHENDKLPQPSIKYVPPRPKFWKEFVLLNYGMMASNNALIPDPDKFDKLSSDWWEWPILHTGLRMCSWSIDDVKYFLIGHPFITWFSTFTLIAFILYFTIVVYMMRRQKVSFDILDSYWNDFLIQGIIPFLAWMFHYIPFILMGRVKYLHHYVPALYFAIFVSGFFMESVIYKRAPLYISYLCYTLAYILILAGFTYYKDLALGMEGSSSNYQHLKLLSSWIV